MIENEYDSCNLICDACGETITFDYGCFDEAVEYIKNNNWQSKYNKQLQDWENYCPECKEE